MIYQLKNLKFENCFPTETNISKYSIINNTINYLHIISASAISLDIGKSIK